MLNVTFACGAETRVPYNPDETVADVLEAVRGHDKAAEAAPGRERAYLAAAVNSAALAAARATADGGEAAAADAGVSVLLGKAFVADPPFPPKALAPSATLEASGVKAEGRVYVTFIAPQRLTDPTEGVRGVIVMPKRYRKCTDVPSPVASSTVVFCDGTCGRKAKDGQEENVVIGGHNNEFRGTSPLCRTAIYAGALDRVLPGAFTVSILAHTSKFLQSGPAERNGIRAVANYDDDSIPLMTVTAYEAGDEDRLCVA
uniref:LCCL domain-containing protein n=1 Tax=Neobodo designis TaxID=312471 RepID=A0A7S1Q0T2_NEODS|mmetsp:Transcript_26710/g.82634  ORF Transcript_26710/g.82634 Transcript_26710/m.82634 type:complete len:258 (+) Transcript_26710:108-881(+)